MPRQAIPMGIARSTGRAMPSAPAREVKDGSLALLTALQHCIVPVLHTAPPPLATWVTEAAALVATAKAIIKETRDL